MTDKEIREKIENEVDEYCPGNCYIATDLKCMECNENLLISKLIQAYQEIDSLKQNTQIVDSSNIRFDYNKE